MKSKIGQIKKNTVLGWLKTFPSLNKFTQNKLYQGVGPFLCGIELTQLPRTRGYRPHFAVYPLWKKGVKECLDTPSILKSFRDENGLEISIEYLNHKVDFSKKMKLVEAQIKLGLGGDVIVDEIIDMIDDYSKDFIVKNNPMLQIKLYELKFYGALYLNDFSFKDLILSEILEVSEGWDTKVLDMWSFNLNDWLKKLEKIERNALMKIIDENKSEKKLNKITFFDLISLHS